MLAEILFVMASVQWPSIPADATTAIGIGAGAAALAVAAAAVVHARTARLERLKGEAERGAEQSLYWNSRFPDNVNVLYGGRSRPGRVFVGDVYVFETALEATSDERSATTPIRKTDTLIGTEVVFDLQGTGVIFSADSRHGPFSEMVVSRPLLCSAAGTEAFRVFCRIEQPGDVLIKGRLLVRNNKLLGQEIRLVAYSVREDEPDLPGSPGKPKGEALEGGDHSGVIEDSDVLVEAPAVRLGLDLKEAKYRGEDWCFVRIRADGQTMDWARTHDKKADLIGKAVRHRATLAELSLGYRPASSGKDFALEPEYADRVKLTFAQIGSELHSALFASDYGAPDESDADPLAVLQAKDIAIQRRERGQRPKVQIEAPALPIPWALLYDGLAYGATLKGHASQRYQVPLLTVEDVDVECFWGRRFAIFHDVQGVRSLSGIDLGAGSVRVQPVLNPTLEAGIIKNQMELFASSPASRVRLDMETVLTERSEFLSWVKAGDNARCDILYLFCHAWAPGMYDEYGLPSPVSHSLQSYVVVADQSGGDGRVTVAEMQKEWDRKRHNRPLVFLNACSTAQSDSLYGTPFVDHFMTRWQGRALVGTEWVVPAAFADAFSRLVVAELRSKKTLINALQTASDAAFEEDNFFPLIYTLYGVPHLRG
jgi:hypothetical protein